MFKKIVNKLFKSKQVSSNEEAEDSFVWHDKGPDNFFNVRLLDIRSFSTNITSAASDQQTVDLFWEFRNSDGQYVKDLVMKNPMVVDCNLVYAYDGEGVDGVVLKSDAMELKWDIYVYGNVFYFTKSWTGDLIFKAYAEIGDTEIKIYKIEYQKDSLLMTSDNPEYIEDCVHFLMVSHVLGFVIPHPIPDWIDDEETSLIAQLSFKQFGRVAFYATKERITDVPYIN